MESVENNLVVIEGGKSAEGATPHAGSKQWGMRVRKRARELSETLDLGYMELARVLYQVWDTPIDGDPNRAPIYTSWGFDSFADYSERELNLNHKKAERLRLIWYTLEVQLKDMDSKLKDRIVNLGYSKVRELIRVLTIRNAEMWIEQAENLTYRQLYKSVIDEKRNQEIEPAILGPGGIADQAGAAGTGDSFSAGEDAFETFKQKRFDLAPAQLENVSLALKKCSDLSGSEKEGHLLDLICTDFIATNDVMGDDMDKRLRYLAKIERVLQLKLVAVDPSTKEIIYGIQALEMVSAE